MAANKKVSSRWVGAMLSHSFVAIRRAIMVDVRELGDSAHCSPYTKFSLITPIPPYFGSCTTRNLRK